MEQIRPLLIKYIYTAAITIIFLTYLLVPSVPLVNSMIIALFITLILYYAGDRFILPRFGTLATAISNFVFAAIVLAVANGFVPETLTSGIVLAAAAVIGVTEWFFFRYARSEVASSVDVGDLTAFPEFLGESPVGSEGEEYHNQENRDEQHEENEGDDNREQHDEEH